MESQKQVNRLLDASEKSQFHVEMLVSANQKMAQTLLLGKRVSSEGLSQRDEVVRTLKSGGLLIPMIDGMILI